MGLEMSMKLSWSSEILSSLIVFSGSLSRSNNSVLNSLMCSRTP